MLSAFVFGENIFLHELVPLFEKLNIPLKIGRKFTSKEIENEPKLCEIFYNLKIFGTKDELQNLIDQRKIPYKLVHSFKDLFTTFPDGSRHYWNDRLIYDCNSTFL